MTDPKDNIDKLEQDVQKGNESSNYSLEEQKIIDDLKLIKDASRTNALEEKKKLLKNIEEEKSSSKIRRVSLKKLFIPLSLAASLLIIAVFLFNSENGIINNRSPLFDEYFEVYPELLSTRGDADIQKQERDAILFYKSKHYDRAAESFSELYTQSNKSVYNFYAGISNLLNDNTDLAIEQLVSIKDSSDVQNIPVKYYLGLAYLKNGDKENAKVIFENPDRAFQYYKEKSAEILEKLNN